MISLLSKKIYRIRARFIYIFHNRFKKSSLENYLTQTKKSNWLDIGSFNNKSNLNFDFCDLYPEEECPPELKDKYFQLDITKELTSNHSYKRYDFIRMQHVFEHFSFEEADVVLNNCFKLLKKNGILLISVPDLDIMIKLYKKDLFKENLKFYNWAIKRIDKDSALSNFFSIFTHSLSHQEHKWCYNKNGLVEKIEASGLFKNTKRISLFHRLSNIPFTHNRPEEDLCVITRKKY